jgi:Fur family ferric uptake transcriptional regulator
MKNEEKILKQRNIKPTAMRLLVVEKLLKQQYAISHKDLVEQFENADNITLFRTLKTFLEQKLIHTIDDGTGIVKYALCQPGCTCKPSEQHTHFHCSKCNHTYCLTDTEMPQLNIPKNFKLEGVNLVLKGICDRCN